MRNEKVTLEPLFLQVAKDITEQFTYGDFIPDHWMHNAFEVNLRHPDADTRDQEKMKFARGKKELDNVLLEQHKMRLRAQSTPAGYRIVLPKEQAKLAEDDCSLRIHREMRKAGKIIVNTNMTLLDAEEKREHADALARMGLRQRMLEQKPDAKNWTPKEKP